MRLSPRGYTRPADDAHAILGVRRGASAEECKQAFRTLALTVHPDVNPSADAAVRFAAAVGAIETILSGPQRGSRGPQGVRSVGGVLVVSIDEPPSADGAAVTSAAGALTSSAAPVAIAPANRAAAASADVLSLAAAADGT